MSTVWVTQKPKYDISAARQYGSIRIVFPSRFDILSASRQAEHVRNTVLPKAERTDYVLLVGAAALQASLLTEWYRLFSEAQVLVWRRHTESYIVWRLDVRSLA